MQTAQRSCVVLGDTWSTRGLHVVYTWSTRGLHVVYTWSTRGRTWTCPVQAWFAHRESAERV